MRLNDKGEAEQFRNRRVSQSSSWQTEAWEYYDAIGEITNMTVGTFKNQLSDKGFPCKLTIPSIMRGSNIQVDSISRANRRTYRFIVGEHVLIADLFMQPLSE